MSSRSGFYDVTNSSPPTTNSPFRSCQSLNGTDSPIFHSPRSSPDVERMRSENAAPNENTPLITNENHYGRAADNQSELSMSLVFPGSSNSFEAEAVPFWKHIRCVFIVIY